VLGYTGSSYPNPNGLAGIADIIPIKAPVGATTTIRTDATPGGAGKTLVLEGPVGANASGADGFIGGVIALQGGEGGLGAPGFRSGSGGSVSIAAGNAGALNGGTAAVINGIVVISAGSSTNAASGGTVSIDAGLGATLNGDVNIGTAGTTEQINLGAIVRESVDPVTNVVGGETIGNAALPKSIYFLSNTTGGAINLNALTPIFQPTLVIGTLGYRIALINADLSDDVVIPAGGNVLLAGGVAKTLGSNGYFEAVFDGTKWVQTAYNQSSA
jgi:hypothetical protein